ncbi:MAG: low-specificity L-threonine aldolase [Chloroflexi bacterium]|nr:low-specificity L-threonine aldolase [Chloroflexota bacterium]
MEWIDLRSDTVTQPTEAMRAAMARAAVGDDVYGEDPTVNRLQEMSAALLGKEAALFVPSGTMGNLAAILAHCGRGDEAILGDKSHTFLFEAGGISALGGVHSRQISNQADGGLALEDIRLAIREDDPHDPISRLVGLENTHNRCGGTVQSVEYTRAVGELAHEHGLALHLDGARIFNAAAALNLPARALAEPADSVTFCLSKGLCAPVGSVLCGSREFIRKAHRMRKQLGGGMRQAGVLAAAGIVALESMVERLAEDHAHARQLAAGLSAIPGLELDPAEPATNMVFVNLPPGSHLDAPAACAALKQRGVLAGAVAARRLRLVTHHGIEKEDIAQAVSAFHEAMAL